MREHIVIPHKKIYFVTSSTLLVLWLTTSFVSFNQFDMDRIYFNKKLHHTAIVHLLTLSLFHLVIHGF